MYTTGESQTGRFSRQLIYEGFTTDEQGRQAVDAMLIRVGGTSLGPFNRRFGTPNDLGVFTETRFPIRYEVTTDPATGKQDGLGARVPAGQEPKIFLFDSGSEYWNQGRAAAILVTFRQTAFGSCLTPNERIFYPAGRSTPLAHGHRRIWQLNSSPITQSTTCGFCAICLRPVGRLGQKG